MNKHCSSISFMFFLALQVAFIHIGFAQSQFGIQEQPTVVNSTTKLVKNDTLFQLEVKLQIDSNWIVYDSIAGEDGPIPFTVLFSELKNVKVVGVDKGSQKKKFDEVFDIDIYFFENQTVYTIFLQQIDPRLPCSVSGSFEYMCCNLSSGVCLPPVNNSFDFKEK